MSQRYVSRISYYATNLRVSLHMRLAVVNVVSGLFPDFFSGVIRTRLYRKIGFAIGTDSFIMGNVLVSGSMENMYNQLSLGRRCCVSNHVTVNLDAPLIVGDDVTIGPYVRIYTGTHVLGPGSRRCLPAVVGKPVQIGDGCWLGIGVTVLPGTKLGRGCVVAAGAVVSGEIPANSYVEGIPARVVRELPW